jgi:type I restriction enzyme S subunit
MAVLRPRSSEVNPRFLLYAYLGPEFQKEIDRRTVRGATVDRIPLNEIGEWPIRLPDRRTQDAIAEVLGALDEKIEANLRLAAKADNLWLALASSTIQSIEANEESNQSSDFRPLSSLAKFINGRAFTKDATGTGRMVVRIAELNSGPGDSTVYNDIDVSDEYVAQPGTLLFAWSGSLTVQRWFRPEAIINQHIFRVIPEPNVPIWLIHAHLLQLLPSYQRIAAGKATTMGHIQRRDLDAAVAVPDAETVVRLDTVCSPLWKRALRAETETLTLVALREVLLPKLLMGEIRVRVAEQSVGFAV